MLYFFLFFFYRSIRIFQARRTAFVSATGSDDLAVKQCHRSIQAGSVHAVLRQVSNVVTGQLYWPRSQTGDLTALIFLFFSALARASGTIIYVILWVIDNIDCLLCIVSDEHLNVSSSKQLVEDPLSF